MKKYLIECHVFDGIGEDDCYEMFADTLDEADRIAAEEESDEDEGGRSVQTEITETEPDIKAAFMLAEQAGISVIRCEDEWWAGQFDGSNGDWWFDIGPVIDKSASLAIIRAFNMIKLAEK